MAMRTRRRRCGETDEEESVEEEPLSELVERLDTNVFGLVEALMRIGVDLPGFSMRR